MQYERRPRLTPAIADVRRAVRAVLPADGLVLVGLSGGADSLALAAATAFEAHRAGLRAGAVIVDHNLQSGSAAVAARAAGQARFLGLDPVLVLAIDVPPGADGPESAARDARYDAFTRAIEQTGACAVVLGHTLDDQAETVLLGLARGSGPGSLHGMAARSGPWLRPLLGIRRAQTHQFCLDVGLTPWHDPQNRDPRYARVRARQTVLPMLERELGPGIAEALARTAEQLREDADALDALVPALLAALPASGEPGRRVAAVVLQRQPAALRQRMIRAIVRESFGISLDRSHTLRVAALVTDWHGQGSLDLPGVRVIRQDGDLVFSRSGPAPIEGHFRSYGTPRHS
ncbi:tRNA lysidine(34) synthetase TilS [Cryobacterium melibiosiphilum]|uniref:tRNA(Ile)-lysidine synthase n=1 Tax=Cryobacterium melibiosiphilum TaxID=995039 RepID=A0A3A5M806_9MICO|nr:tRNA lysidine(34) synthetase TilS [Cryobacterium melibiosiphilum]RJT85093.1 tRNA lysidine(34) synthetase TilS [Cryobacterium melibiosiphilum]